MNFEKYIGIPFLEKGRDATGLDCWGLVRLIYKQEYNINLPSFATDYTLSDDDRIGELFAQYKEGWEVLDNPQPGSAVIFRMFGTESHIGVVVDNSRFIHVREGRDTVIESLESGKWAKRIVGFFQYSEKSNVVLNAVPHPLKTQLYTTTVVPGTLVSELVQNICQEYNIQPELKSRISVLVNGQVVAQEAWATTRIKLGDVVEYRAVPGKEVVRVIAVVALVYFTAGLAAGTIMPGFAAALGGAGTFGAALGAAAVSMIGGALINAIAPIRPPAAPSDPGTSLRQDIISGGQNRGNPYGSIPVVLGKLRITPPLGSNNYLSFENERDSFLSMLLVWGYGPLVIDASTLKIGGVPLSSFPKHTISTLNRISEPTAAELTTFNSIYGQDYSPAIQAGPLVCEGNPEVAVAPGPWVNAATDIELDVVTGFAVPVTQVRIDLHFPQGLRYIISQGDGAGESRAVGVVFRVEYSTNGGTSYAYLDEFTIGGDTPKKDAFTTTKAYNNLNYPQLIVRVRRQTGDNVEDNTTRRYYFDSVLQNITFVRNTTPAVDPVGTRIAKTAFKIQASEQLNGSLEGISAVVQTWCKIWNGSAWVDGASSNPAALMRYVLEHPANPRRVTDASTQINLAQLQYFYTYCESKGFEYNDVLSTQRSILEVIRDICAAGRASPALLDGKWTVVIDEPRANVVQHFTPHNSWNFEGTKALPKRPDGLRVTYYDQAQDYQQAEIIVYENGKSSVTATLFESINLPGVTKKSLVIDHARWHLAQMKLRPEVYTINTDLEYLVCNRGDRVKVVHDVPMWGIGSGRVSNRISGTQLELDETMPMKAGVTYTIRFRSSTGSSVTRTVTPKFTDGYYDVIDVTSTTATEVNAGDLFLFGELNQESQDLIVLAIEPSTNNSARITLVDYGVTDTYNIFNDYLSLSAATIFETQITLPPVLQQNGFGDKIPTITGFVSDESVMERVSKGVFKYAINVAYVNNAQLPETTEAVQLEYELLSSSSSVGSKIITVPFQKGSVTISDVAEGETYKVKVRYVGSTGICGKWTSYSNHTVVGKINPPAQVTGFAVSADKSSGQLLLSWAENSEPDTTTYEVRIENFNWGFNDASRIFYGDATKTFVTYNATASSTFYIRAVDSSGNYSLNSSTATFSPATIPNITDIIYSYADTALTSATVTLNWADVTNSQFAVDFYELTYNSTTKTVKANSINLPADWLGDRIFTIKTVDILGNKSSGYSEAITKLAPTPPTDVRTQVVDNTVMLYWTLPARTSLPIDHILIKKGSLWSTAEILGDKKGEFTTINESSGGNFTYWLAAVDTEGIQSTPISVSTLVSEPPDFVFHGEFNSTFTGTKVSAAYDGSVLALPVNTTETFAQHFTARSWTTPQDQVNAGYPVFIQPSGSTGYYEEIFDFGQPLASSRVSLNFTGVATTGTPVVVPKISLSLDNVTYIDYNGNTDVFGLNFRYVKIRITVTSSPTNIGLYEISQLSVRLDAKLKNDAGSVLASSSDTLGTIVNFSKEFIDVQSITLAPAATTPVIPVYDMKDAFVSGTYSITSDICTVNITSHGMITGQNIKLFINTSTGIAGIYTVTGYTADTFTVNMVTPNTTGNCSIYPQSFRVYLFNNSGTRVSADASWAIKGY